MAEKTLKATRRKVTPKKSASEEETGIVLVGTYKDKQLAWIKKHGVYNYPIKDEDELKPESCAKVKELWLYASAKGKRYCFAAEFVGIQSKDQFLAANPTYKNLGQSKHTRYMVFKTTVLDYGPRLDGATVFARVSDFEKGRGRTKKIAAAIKQFHADGDFGLLADYLPNDLAKLPREQLRVCEAAVQLDFMSVILPAGNLDGGCLKSSIEYICEVLGCEHGTPGWPDDFGRALRTVFRQNSFRRIRTLSLFSGAGGLDIGFSDAGFDIIRLFRYDYGSIRAA